MKGELYSIGKVSSNDCNNITTEYALCNYYRLDAMNSNLRFHKTEFYSAADWYNLIDLVKKSPT